MLQDIAILTGGQVISDELGLDLKEAKMEQLGRAKSVKVAKENTVIVEMCIRDRVYMESLMAKKKHIILNK